MGEAGPSAKVRCGAERTSRSPWLLRGAWGGGQVLNSHPHQMESGRLEYSKEGGPGRWGGLETIGQTGSHGDGKVSEDASQEVTHWGQDNLWHEHA